ncbi:MAG: 5-oxoprolinase subunit PxpA [Gemmataceae bacterium]
MIIDLNCDLGEGCPLDGKLMPLITSANVACGGHAGDLATSLKTLQLARLHGVQVGAHPGYLDRDSFGRQEQVLSERRIYLECQAQITALAELALIADVSLCYLKPHGALYNQACRDETYARPVVQVAEEHGLAVMGLPGSRLAKVAEGRCPFIPEGFADRRYLPDGSLVPRSSSEAFVKTPDEAILQAKSLVQDRGVRTLCVHGDNSQALAFLTSLREAFLRDGWTIQPFALP